MPTTPTRRQLANAIRALSMGAVQKANSGHPGQDRHARGGATSLVVDEAQSLPFELLEELRLLVNLETATVKLLNVILVSQPELAEGLNDPALRQLKQRISLRCELVHLDLRETAAYIAGRLRIPGANVSEVFTRDAVLAVDEYARGIPRVISVVCDNALVAGFAFVGTTALEPD